MSNLADFLLVRIAEDEADARTLTPYSATTYDGREPMHVRCDPYRLLAECEAKRRIVEEHQRCGPTTQGYSGLRFAVQVLALPYADHPDYREEWKP